MNDPEQGSGTAATMGRSLSHALAGKRTAYGIAGRGMLYALMSGSSAILWNALESIDSETQSAFLEAFPSELISVGEFKQLLLIVAVLTAILALMQIAILYSIKRRQENVE